MSEEFPIGKFEMIDDWRKTGIYMAYPTTSVMKSIYRPKNYKTKVNNRHTKVGIAKDSFDARAKGYFSNFDNEVVFEPLIVISDIDILVSTEKILLQRLLIEFQRVGRAREWFDTDNHCRIREIVDEISI